MSLFPAKARLSSRCLSPFNKARARSSACHQHSRAAASPLREAPILVAAPISPAKRINRAPTRYKALSRYALASPARPTAGAHERSVSADHPLPQAVQVPAPESAPDAAGCCGRGQPASAEEKNRRSESVVSPERSRSPPAIAAPAPHIRLSLCKQPHGSAGDFEQTCSSKRLSTQPLTKFRERFPADASLT